MGDADKTFRVKLRIKEWRVKPALPLLETDPFLLNALRDSAVPPLGWRTQPTAGDYVPTPWRQTFTGGTAISCSDHRLMRTWN